DRGNTLPELQMSVLNQIERPKFVLLDTIRLWIENRRDALLQVIGKVDAIVLNDEEIRLITDITSIPKAVAKLFSLGPKVVIVKRGEHGATMHFASGEFFALPAIPISDVIDPTGAGDSFAGGFMGRLAVEGSLNQAAFRRALVAGTVVASFTVQAFGLEKLVTVTPAELAEREAFLLQSIRVA
ncbi:MAG: PfkB family carbohydrate kinase, partial [bacterium]|nr:PfkB family carbohydrate kinase [bacterium]